MMTTMPRRLSTGSARGLRRIMDNKSIMDAITDWDARFQAAAEAIRTADALLIGAGAGMGVDSGLPDFRGPEGFWKAYPPFRGKQFGEISTPHWFQTDPGLGVLRTPFESVSFGDPASRL